MIPKIVDSQAKGKGRANTPDGMSESIQSHHGDSETIASGLLPDAGLGNQAARIDMLTGVTAPVLTRVPRQKKETTTPSSRSKKQDAANKAPRSKKSAKAKGKEKAVPLPEAVMPMDEGFDDADDIYMDE